MASACLSSFRFHLLSGVVLAAFVLVAARLFTLQVVQAEEIRQSETPQRERIVTLAAKRGDILDRNGNVLAGTRSRVQVGLDPHAVDAEPRAWARLAGILQLDYSELLAAVARTERVDGEGRRHAVRWVPLAEVDEDLFAAVMNLGLKGVYGNRRYDRHYPGHELAAHIIGYLNREHTAVMGVEQAMDFYLRGQDGRREIAVDGRRKELAAFRSREIAPRHGQDIVLTLDLMVQATAEAALAELVERTQPAGAMIIISDPASGEVLGLANHPGFDPNRFWEFPLEAQRNRAVSDQHEPGSTFKIIPYAAALDDGLMHRGSIIDCSITHVTYNNVRIPLPNDIGNYGELTLEQALQKSSNRAAAQVGIQLGQQKLYDWSKAFGIGESIGWPLSGAANGRLVEPRRWDGYAISRIPTGYAVAATPMQMHLAMAAIANDGEWVAPRLLREVRFADGTVLPLGSTRSRKVLSTDTADELKRMLARVVETGGTATGAAIDGYQVAGKTGTARKLVDGRYSREHHFASFSGFFPAQDPRVVITVMVDDPTTGSSSYGGAVAGPTFHTIGERLIPHLGIRKPEHWETLYVSKE